jgi:hypothetical protein
MTRFSRQVTLLLLSTLATLATARTAVAARWDKLDRDRGDVPGWAIASGAAVVLGLAVYAAFRTTINKYIAQILSG